MPTALLLGFLLEGARPVVGAPVTAAINDSLNQATRGIVAESVWVNAGHISATAEHREQIANTAVGVPAAFSAKH